MFTVPKFINIAEGMAVVAGFMLPLHLHWHWLFCPIGAVVGSISVGFIAAAIADRAEIIAAFKEGFNQRK